MLEQLGEAAEVTGGAGGVTGGTITEDDGVITVVLLILTGTVVVDIVTLALTNGANVCQPLTVQVFPAMVVPIVTFVAALLPDTDHVQA